MLGGTRETINADFMNQPAVFIFMALLGCFAGALAQRARASGRMALMLPLVPGLAFWLLLAGRWG